MYVLHKPEHHKGKKWADLKDASANKDEDTSKPASDLQLAAKLKEVLCTNLCMNSDDVDKLLNEAGPSN